jgi:ankyrin repeat protein
LNKLLAEPPKSDEEKKQNKACLDALLLTDPVIDRRKLKRTKGKRVAGTCEWIEENKLYRSWLESETHLLWISGGPGKGKTMLSIYLTKELKKFVKEKPNANLLFYFCINEDKNRNTAVAILRGLLYQIIKQRPSLTKHAWPYLDSPDRARATLECFDTLWLIFKTTVGDPELGIIFCVLDGLDECDKTSARDLLTHVVNLTGSQSTEGRLKLIVVSRDIIGLQGFARVKLDPDNDERVTRDIERFISVGIEKLSTVSGFDSIRSFVQNTLLRKSEGTFLWVGFIINELSPEMTCTEILETMENFPKGLNPIYRRILLHIQPKKREPSALILRWVTMAIRPLLLQELQELQRLAKAVSTPRNALISSDQAFREQLALCGPFLKIHEDGVSLIHQSARDYLLQKEPYSDPVLEEFRIKPDEAHLELAQYCLDYIERSDLQRDVLHVNDQSLRQESPLLSYAVVHWPEHTRCSAEYAHKIFDKSRPFFRNNSPLRRNWWESYRRMKAEGEGENLPLLHIASYFGVEEWVKKILATEAWKFWSRKIAEKDSLGRTPLLCAASGGHKAMVEQLLKSGADVNVKDHRGGTMLMWAAEQGHEAVVRLLFHHGADVNAQDKGKRTALMKATWQGHEEMVRLLLEHGANVNTKDFRERAPLIFGAERGHEAVVRLLLNSGANVTAKDMGGGTAMMKAARQGYEVVVQLLLDHGADVNARDDRDMTALMSASEEGHEAVVQLLLHHGAEIDMKDEQGGRTALMWATEHNKEKEAVVQLLLDHNANVNMKDSMDGRTALMKAALQDHKTVVKLLLGHSADVNVKDERGGVTALMLAAEGGNEVLVRLLLDHGADINAKDTWRKWTALMRAIERDHEQVVQLLLDSNADVNSRYTEREETALMWAAEQGRGTMIKLLLDHRADINAEDWANGTALMRAVEKDQEAIVLLLLNHGASIDASSWQEGTALMRAARRGNKAILQQLLNSGADVNMEDNLTGQTALMRAVEKDHEKIVQLLLDHGANVNASSSQEGTALMRAAERGNKPITQLLLDHGADINMTNAAGQTVIMKAVQRGHECIVQLLESAQTS